MSQSLPSPLDAELKPIRDQIDAIDERVIALLSDRANLAEQVGEIKKRFGAPVFRPEREMQVLRHIVGKNPGPLHDDSLKHIYREVISACRALENVVRVAFLGPVGTFSEAAVHAAFGHSVEALPCAGIDEVFRAAEAESADFGVVPVENSTEGVVNRTLDLFLQTPLRISSQIELPVHHNLMTQTGTMRDANGNKVQRICAHGQALAQCATWLATHHADIERIPVVSNAHAAQLAQADSATAAIAGEAAAAHYGLQLVARHIQDDPHNTTRFAVIGRLEAEPSGHDQTSIVVAVPHVAGSVHQMLEPLARHGVSMTMFESRPSRGRFGNGVWTYYFYIDLEGHQATPNVAAALAELKSLCPFFKVLGSYPLV